MPTVFCPNCSDLVEREGYRCPRCGIDLYATFPETDSQRTPPAGNRLEFPTGETFANRYTIIERIGAGGMGVVYKAIDTMLESEVALKLIQPALAQFPGFIERFRREVRLTRQITHPNICRFHDMGDSDGVLYVSMEWIEGETLGSRIVRSDALRDVRPRLARQCGEILARIHAIDLDATGLAHELRTQDPRAFVEKTWDAYRRLSTPQWRRAQRSR